MNRKLFLFVAFLALIFNNTLYAQSNFAIQINAGGTETDYNTATYVTDNYFNTGNTLDRPQTGLPEPFQSFRYSPSQQMSYDIPLDDGEYIIKLYFAELWFGATGGGTGGIGSRVFDVNIEGDLAEDNLDVFAAVGADAMLIKSHTVTVTGGILNIDFDSRDEVGGERHPIINAIEILGKLSVKEVTIEGFTYYRSGGSAPFIAGDLNNGDNLYQIEDDAFFAGFDAVVSNQVKSVRYELVGPAGAKTITLNVDESPIWNEGEEFGMHTITATPYSEIDEGGEFGNSFTITYEISNHCDAIDIETYSASSCTATDGYAILLDGAGNNSKYTSNLDELWEYDEELDGFIAKNLAPGTYQISCNDRSSAIDIIKTFEIGARILCPEPNDFALRINAGGSEIAYNGNTFVADANYNTGNILNRPQTGVPLPFQTFRYSPSQEMAYAIPVPNGEYRVNLFLAELWFGAIGGGAGGAGNRVFDITIEGQLVQDNYDVYAEVGSEAIVKSYYSVTVTDGILNIGFDSRDAVGGERHPIINAIEILGEGTITTTDRPFITTWKTDNSGVSADNQITIPTYSGETYDYALDWGDGTTSENITGTITHTYATPGEYQISISGEFPYPYFSVESYEGIEYSDGSKLISVNQWGDIKWRNMYYAFQGCNLELLATDAPNLSAVVDMSYMFTSSTLNDANLNDWDTSNVKNMSSMFFGTSFNGEIGNWNVANVNNMHLMFGHTREFNRNIGNWNVSNVFDMGRMFDDAEKFNQDIGNWDVSKVADMGEMFSGAENFNQDIGRWDVSNVTSMGRMFANAKAFNQEIRSWDVSNLIYINGMFSGAESFNQDIGGWDVSNAINMSYMFGAATKFNQDIGDWDVSNVANMSWMFSGAENFNQDIGDWDVSNVTEMDRMFLEAASFNQNIGNWDVSHVVEMRGMFADALSFNQDIGDWNIASVNEMIEMFSNVGLSLENYDDTLIGWSNKQVQRGVLFDGGNSQYCQSTEARQKLIDGFAWRIYDGGRTSDCTSADVFVLRINTGGSALSFNFKDYASDTYFDRGRTLDRPQTRLVGHYRSFRYSTSQQMGYDIPLPDGEYIVKLHFAELWFGATGGGSGGVGSRVFDVNIEGQLVQDNLDIFAEVGAEAMLVKTHTVMVSDGVLEIDFDSRALVGGERHPVINGVEIIQSSVVTNETTSLKKGVASEQPENNMSIYPNQVSDIATLSLEEPLAIQQVLVFDMIGRIIKSYGLKSIQASKSFTLDVNELQQGTYIVKIVDNQGASFQKQMVVKRQ